MMKKITSIILSVVFLVFTYVFPSLAKDYGLVTDKSGAVEHISKGKKFSVDMGTNLMMGDELVLKGGSSLTILSYEDCREWAVKGPGIVKVSSQGLIPNKGKKKIVSPLRQLPICYSPEEMEGSDSQIMGGFVMRGQPADPMEPLRQEFAAGKAGNSSLMTLIMHDLKNNRIEKARPYFIELKRRKPDSPFVHDLGRRFR